MNTQLIKNDGKYNLQIRVDDDDEWLQLPALEELGDEEIIYLTREIRLNKDGTPKGSSIEKLMYTWCTITEVDYTIVQTEVAITHETINIVRVPLTPILEVNQRPPVKIREVHISDIPPLTYTEEVCATVILSSQYPREGLNCKPALWIIGPSGTGKSESLYSCTDDDLVNWIGRSTENAWTPGRPNADIDRPQGIFERSHMRCIVVNESSNFASERNAEKVLAQMADILTMGMIPISDPVEDFNVVSDVTGIFGMTHSIYRKMINTSTGIGQRYLMLETKNNRLGVANSAWKRLVDKETRREQLVNLIRTAKNLPISTPTNDMLNLAHIYAEYTMDAISAGGYASTLDKAMGSARLGDQLVFMALMRSNLYNHTPSTDDVRIYLELLAPMITHRKDWKKLLNYMGDNTPVDPRDFDDFEKDLEIHLDGMRIIESVSSPVNHVKIIDGWYNYLKEMEMYW